MTSQPPPTYNFSGINYNSLFFNSTPSGLTTATANNLYLRKTFSDTATSLETFSGGIATTNITSPELDAPEVLNIGNTTATGANIGRDGINTNIVGTFSLSSPLVLGSTPTVNTQLGFRTGNLLTVTTYTSVAASTAYNATSFTFPTSGTWFVELRARQTTASQNYVVSLNTNIVPTISFSERTMVISNNAGGFSCEIATTVNTTSSTIWYITVRSAVANSNFQDMYVYATRIA